MKLGVDAAFVGGVLVPGDVLVEGERIGATGLPADGAGRIATSGFVDLQVNGYAGVDFAGADVAGYQRAARAMVSAGVTTFQPTFITLPWDSYAAAIAVAAAARPETPGMWGLHLEGPFLAPLRCGAHDPANIVAPTPDRIDELAVNDVVTWTTVAPDVAGGLEAVHQFAAHGKTVAIGHSNATAAVAHAALEAGASAITHLFNAQSSFNHRDPGVPGVALDDQRALLTLIVDGHHLAPEVVRLVFAAAPGRVALITDAIAATGLGDGAALLGDRTVTVVGSQARLSDGTLAGSVLTMDRAIRTAIESGVELEAALAAATASPARRLGDSVPADLRAGTVADVAILGPDLAVQRTLRRGAEVFSL